jgi:hypothetical protein
MVEGTHECIAQSLYKPSELPVTPAFRHHRLQSSVYRLRVVSLLLQFVGIIDIEYYKYISLNEWTTKFESPESYKLLN